MEMDMRFLRKLPVPKEIKERFPVDKSISDIKEARDKEMKAIFDGSLDKFILIIGPCSADNEDSVLDYTIEGDTLKMTDSSGETLEMKKQ